MCPRSGCISPTRRMSSGSRTEEELAEIGLPPPFWAFAWAGGQGLARYVLDHPDSGARQDACSISPPARGSSPSPRPRPARRVWSPPTSIRSAPRRSASMPRQTASTMEFCGDDLIGQDEGWDVVLAGDVFYDKAFADRLTPWFSALTARGADSADRRSRPLLSAEGPAAGTCRLPGAGDARAGGRRGQAHDGLAICVTSAVVRPQGQRLPRDLQDGVWATDGATAAP